MHVDHQTWHFVPSERPANRAAASALLFCGSGSLETRSWFVTRLALKLRSPSSTGITGRHHHIRSHMRVSVWRPPSSHPHCLKHSMAPHTLPFFLKPAPSQSQTQTNLVSQTEGCNAHRPKTTQHREYRQAEVVVGKKWREPVTPIII